MKKVISLVLALLMLTTMLCACESTEEKYAALAGTWQMVTEETEENTRIRLENIDLYEEELAVVDMEKLYNVWIYEFDMGGNFRQTDDIPAMKEYVRAFYHSIFEDLFENRADLGALYETDFAAMDQAAFQQFYAELYGLENYDAMLDQFVENAYKWDEWTDYRNGTFVIKGDYLEIIDGGESYRLGYESDGDTLTITYSDGTEVYTKVG